MHIHNGFGLFIILVLVVVFMAAVAGGRSS
jgi:hypothetical protein